MTLADVNLWGTRIGSVRKDESGTAAAFEYDRDFLRSGIQVSPIAMPLGEGIFRFPELSRSAFAGLPGLLADSLPDRFGNQLIDHYLATQGRRRADFNAVERLCYVGDRGMGALEFEPGTGPAGFTGRSLDISELRGLANAVLADDSAWASKLGAVEDVQDILQVGTSAGGARPKAVIVWNPATDEVRSGRVEADSGFEYWMLKFDGVTEPADREIGQGLGYGLIEFAYSRLARAAGIEMTQCRLYSEGDRRHFMTKRFDRTDAGDKLHMHTFGGLCHFDFNENGMYSYEEVFHAMRRLKLPASQIEQQFKRMVFNIVARNQDDHVKNIAFLMDRSGDWSLAPAYDVTYSYNPGGRFTSAHQMSMNGKTDDFTLTDFAACGESAILRRGHWRESLEEVMRAVERWPDIAADVGVDGRRIAQIAATHRLKFAE